MKVTSTRISGLKIVQSKIYRDNRGLLKEIFKQKLFKNDDFGQVFPELIAIGRQLI